MLSRDLYGRVVNTRSMPTMLLVVSRDPAIPVGCPLFGIPRAFSMLSHPPVLHVAQRWTTMAQSYFHRNSTVAR